MHAFDLDPDKYAPKGKGEAMQQYEKQQAELKKQQEEDEYAGLDIFERHAKKKEEKAKAKAEAEKQEAKLQKYRDSLSDSLTDEQKDELVKQYEKNIEKEAKKEAAANRDHDTMLYDAYKASAGYTGEELDKKLWDSVSDGYKDHIAKGDYAYIDQMRSVIKEAGGSTSYFDEQIKKASTTALKKSIGTTDGSSQVIHDYLVNHCDMSEAEISANIVYKSEAAKDFKAACRLNDEDLMVESLRPLLQAGLTRADVYRLYKYRNSGRKSYDGKYADRFQSTGKYIWPISGMIYSEDQITSHFGYRNTGISGASNYHQAIDIAAPSGTPVVAVDGGTVIFAGYNGAGGKTVKIQHDDGTITYYQHLSWWDAHVGDTVGQGQTIGNVGSTGVSSGPHLDIRFEVNGELVDPLNYLAS